MTPPGWFWPAFLSTGITIVSVANYTQDRHIRSLDTKIVILQGLLETAVQESNLMGHNDTLKARLTTIEDVQSMMWRRQQQINETLLATILNLPKPECPDGHEKRGLRLTSLGLGR